MILLAAEGWSNDALARWSMSELAAETQRTGLVASISGSTIWRWLHDDAIRPWCHRSWIFPRDPEFATKAGRILDPYERVWEEHPLTADDFVISADEKTSIQARRRRHATQPPRAGAVMKVEHEYTRAGAWAYLAALDVHQERAATWLVCSPNWRSRRQTRSPHEKYVYELMKRCTKL